MKPTGNIDLNQEIIHDLHDDTVQAAKRAGFHFKNYYAIDEDAAVQTAYIELEENPSMLFKCYNLSEAQKLAWLDKNLSKLLEIFLTKDGAIRAKREIRGRKGFEPAVLQKALELIAQDIYNDYDEQINSQKRAGSSEIAIKIRNTAIMVAYPQVLEMVYLKNPKRMQSLLRMSASEGDLIFNLGQKLLFKMLEFSQKYSEISERQVIENYINTHKEIIFKLFKEKINGVPFETGLVEYYFRHKDSIIFQCLDVKTLSLHEQQMMVSMAVQRANTGDDVNKWPLSAIVKAPLKIVKDIFYENERFSKGDDEWNMLDTIINKRELDETISLKSIENFNVGARSKI